MCTLFSRQVTDIASNNMTVQVSSIDYNVSNIAGVSYGLYFYGVEYFNDDDEKITNCQTYPSHLVNDNYVQSARAFSAIALIIGFPIVFLLCLTSCMKLGDRTLRVLSMLLMLVAFCQSMIFVFMRSGRCVKTPNPVGPNFLESTPVWANCTLNNGSKSVIVASVLWCLAAITLGFSSRLSLVEAQLRFASMHISATTTT